MRCLFPRTPAAVASLFKSAIRAEPPVHVAVGRNARRDVNGNPTRHVQWTFTFLNDRSGLISPWSGLCRLVGGVKARRYMSNSYQTSLFMDNATIAEFVALCEEWILDDLKACVVDWRPEHHIAEDVYGS